MSQATQQDLIELEKKLLERQEKIEDRFEELEKEKTDIELEENCLSLLALHQPAARDLQSVRAFGANA